jgi:putative ATP-binding cassette transporter
MEALKLFANYAPNKTFLAIVSGILAGVLYSVLIPLIMTSLSDDNSLYEVEDKLIQFAGLDVANSKFALLFFILCFLILLMRSLSEIILSRLAIDIRFKLRKELYTQVRCSPIVSLEGVGTSRLLQALSTDIAVVVSGAALFPQILTNLITLLSMLTVLAYFESNIFYFVMTIIIFGVLAYQIPVWVGTKYFSRARDRQDVLQEAFKGLVEGAKELKLNENKSNIYHSEVLEDEERTINSLQKTGTTIFSLANNFGDLISFLAIGGIAFIFINYNVVTTSKVITSIMILLYLTGPISNVLNFLPQLATTDISLRKIKILYNDLDTENISAELLEIKPWSKLYLRGVTYKYPLAKNQSHAFEVGPLDVEIMRGEVTFITGGNGSGKSTFAKLITQHYSPMNGDIYFDNVQLNISNLKSYRQEVSCIYSDYYLFSRLLDTKSNTEEYLNKLHSYLKLFDIDKKVQIENGQFSTLKLSDGQRRRLALINIIMEDRALLLFDEWAADQDPQFKNVFYNEILPQLKQNNKAIVVISHDDRYFGVADRLYVMDSGKITETKY